MCRVIICFYFITYYNYTVLNSNKTSSIVYFYKVYNVVNSIQNIIFEIQINCRLCIRIIHFVFQKLQYYYKVIYNFLNIFLFIMHINVFCAEHGSYTIGSEGDCESTDTGEHITAHHYGQNCLSTG